MDPTFAQSAFNTGIDQDGTPNILDQLLQQAKHGHDFNVAIKEPKSIEWLLEREVAELPEYLSNVMQRPRWLPRIGEIVLVVSNMQGDQNIRYDESVGVFKLYSNTLGFVGMPKWEAAVVTQLPVHNSPNIVVSPMWDKAERSAATDGFRVEPMSEIGNSNKAWSTRYTHVHLRHVRPFQFWQELLAGVDAAGPNGYHPTIRHALTCMSSFSLVDRYWFFADGEEARICCRGLFIGSEFIVENDLVRFDSPQHMNSSGKTVMHIQRMYWGVRLDRPDYPSGLYIEGYCYTTDPKHAFGQYQQPFPPQLLPRSDMQGYGNWYLMHDSGCQMTIPFAQLKGRLLEDDYVQLLFSPAAIIGVAPDMGAHSLGMPNHLVDITYGYESVGAGREYSFKFDPRSNDMNPWVMAECRADQLELVQINGQDVGDRARFGFESTPQPLQEQHLKAMFRARAARQKGVKGGSGQATPSLEQMFLTNNLVAGGMNAVENASVIYPMHGRQEQRLDDMDTGMAQTQAEIDNVEFEAGFNQVQK